SSDATHPKALSASNSSELAGMRHSYAAFSMGCKTREPNAIALIAEYGLIRNLEKFTFRWR
ncbi:hypothetical protein, partial [Oceaniovalibus sp. ACAM 378]|uniref:hypothetical protein n=1 Tax=Oceaniovalibus sp. ACAM 378 TaxID=2599923 RepID=UPI001CA31860